MMNPPAPKSGLRNYECAAAGSEHVVLRDMHVLVAYEGVAALAFVVWHRWKSFRAATADAAAVEE